MSSDLRTLIWLQWKRFKGSAAYWLRLLGFEPGANRFYLIYATLFWLFWVYTVWAFVVQQVEQISLTLPSASVIGLQASVPALILLAQLVYLVMVLRDSPLKLSAAEIEYVAVSPVNRGGLVLVLFGRSLLPLAFVAGLASCLFAMLLTWQVAPAEVGIVGLRALALGIPIFGLGAAVAWIVVLVKTALVSRWQQARRLADSAADSRAGGRVSAGAAVSRRALADGAQRREHRARAGDRGAAARFGGGCCWRRPAVG